MKQRPLVVRRIVIGILAVALVAALAFVALRTGPLAPIRVTVTSIQEGKLSPALFGIGTVEARRSWMVGPTVAGRVLNVRVDVGDTVKAGQVLARLDPQDLNLSTQSLEAQRAAAQADLDFTKAEHERFKELLERKRMLAATVRARAPFVDALSRLELRALGHVRREGAGTPWQRVLLLSVNAAAAGLQNTG